MADLGAIGYNYGAVLSPLPAKGAAGVVTLLDGGTVPLFRRKVVLHRRSTSEVVATSYSAVDGSFAVASTWLLHSELHFVVAFDDEGWRNAMIFDGVTLVDLA